MSCKGQKRTFYLDFTTAADIQAEAARQGRTGSWLVRRAWALARERIKAEAPPVVENLPPR